MTNNKKNKNQKNTTSSRNNSNKNNKQHQRTKSFDEETQTHGKGKLSSEIRPSNIIVNPNNNDMTATTATNGNSPIATAGLFEEQFSSGTFGSPTTQSIDFSSTFPNLLSAKEVSIFDLIAAVIIRILTSKRFWTFIFILIIYFIQYNHQELREVGMRYYPKGMQIEEDDRPGLRFNQSRVKVQRPVILIPGFVTTGLELWSGQDCILSDVSTNFRQRVFGTSMIMKLLQNPACYLRHIALHPETGGDPHPRIKVRHDTGMDSVDYIDRSGVYWVWAKLMRNLADIGYEPKNLHVAGYDWRLDPQLTEERYAYFSRLKKKIEGLYEASGVTTSRFDCDDNGNPDSSTSASSPPGRHEQEKQRIVIVFHSYGAIMTREFLNFCDKKEPGWTDKYVAAIVGNGGAHLGIPKADAALTSGEMKDTATLPTVPRRILDSHVLRRTRANAFRTWACLHAMMTRGPEALFPNIVEFTSQLSTSSPSGSLSLSSSDSSLIFASWANSADSFAALEEFARATSTKTLNKLSSSLTNVVAGVQALEEDQDHDEKVMSNENKNKRKEEDTKSKRTELNNEMENKNITPFDGKKLGVQETTELIRRIALATNNTRLVKHIESTREVRNSVPQFPKAKKTQFFCVYGVGLDTEVGYYYKQPQRKEDEQGTSTTSKSTADIVKKQQIKQEKQNEDDKMISEYDLESIEFDFDSTPSGVAVRLGDGDGTVPLMSLGYPCRSKKNGFVNSFGKVTTVEMKHDPAPLDPRGGVHSGDHVDGLGNWDFIDVVLKVVSGLEDEVEDRILSDVDKRVEEVDK